MPFGSRLGRALISLAVLGALLSGWTIGLDTASAERKVVQRKELAPGVVYKELYDPSGPFKIFLVSIDASQKSTLDIALAKDRLEGFEVTSSIAARHKPLAAINGDYPRPSGRPVHTYVEDGSFLQRESVYGRNFSVNRAEEKGYVGHPKVTRVMEATDALETSVDLVNEGKPRDNQLGEYGPEAKKVSYPPRDACSVRLKPRRHEQFTPDGGVYRSYSVDAARCAEGRMSRKGKPVLAATGGDRRTLLSGMQVGTEVGLSWSVGWPLVMDSMGGNPDILNKGKEPRESTIGCGSFCDAHPRTGVGWTQDGTVLYVVVDGRSDASAGMTLHEFAQLFRSLGAVEALNVDGGGSSTMWIKGLGVVNTPSDGSERPVSSALMVLRGTDPGERVASAPDPDPTPTPSPSPDPDPLPTVLPSPLPTLPPIPPSTGSAWESAASDAASTGGLADYLERRGRALPPFMRQLVKDARPSR